MKKNLIIILCITLVQTSKAQEKIISDTKVNVKLNRKLIKSRKKIEGKLNDSENNALRKQLSKELSFDIPDDKNILINYDQKGNNCMTYSYTPQEFKTMMSEEISISNLVTKNNNTIDFFVYNEDSFFINFFKENNRYILDSDFFKKNIFTLSENCEGFFILKTNGEFMKYYGEDYYSDVSRYIENR
jgi:hypothetical protein